MATYTSPPRRGIPPPPQRRIVPGIVAPTPAGADESADAPQAISIAARIAGLRLNPESPYHRTGNSLSIVEHDDLKSASVQIEAPPKAFALLLAGLDPDYLSRLLARPPPPIPDKWDQPPAVPPRRLPPRPPPQPDYDPTAYEDAHEEPDSGHGYEPDGSTDVEEVSSDGLYSSGSCIKCHDFAQVDAHAAQFPRQHVRSLDELADNLTQPFQYETEKARAIFTWLHHNVQYDTQSFFAGTVKPATPQSTLSSGLAVCDGYAGLFVRLAERAGLQVHKVTGHGKGFGYRELDPEEPVPEMSHNHAWNCVLMDGEWRLIDATWGAGALNGSSYNQRFDASWFSSTPAEFGRRHFPEDPSFQLISDEEGGPISWEDYILHPRGPLIYGDFHRLELLPELLQPASDTIENGQTVTFTLFKRCEHMSTREADNYIYALHFPDRQPIPLLPNAEGGWSISYPVSGQTEASLVFISTVDGQDAKGIGTRGFNNGLNRKAMSFGGLAKWTVS